jgi:hypothetical protein
VGGTHRQTDVKQSDALKLHSHTEQWSTNTIASPTLWENKETIPIIKSTSYKKPLRDIPCLHFVTQVLYGFRNWQDRLCGLVIRISGYRSRGPGFDPRSYQIFWERGPLSLVRTIEELLEWKSSGSGLENRGNSLRWPRNILYSQRLALTSPTSGGRSVGIVRLRTTATEFSI